MKCDKMSLGVQMYQVSVYHRFGKYEYVYCIKPGFIRRQNGICSRLRIVLHVLITDCGCLCHICHPIVKTTCM